GTLLSSQGTDASFVLTLSGFPPGASLRCFQPYQILFPFRFRFGFSFRWPLEGLCLSALPHFRPFPLRLIIEALD
ncbi:hypothetical protein E2B92_32220, partial [Streptomyces sp. WAC05374]